MHEIIALPQDEMRDIVSRFSGPAGAAAAAGARDGQRRRFATSPFYTSWLTALKSLDFDKLSRNAQVDYLFIRRTAETQIARANLKLDPNPPRKPDTTGIPGPARGREGLIQDLSEAMIPYTPEELIALAEKEFAWCDQEMLKASREMGFGNDWKKAIEKTKDSAVPPGGQPRMIMDLLVEAVDYLRANRLITVPQVAAESLHMIMMTPERQLVNPFFTGGGQISVSYPTNTMDYDARIQSMRGNNPGFSHATAHHEMIPGHNLVGYLGTRFDDYRANLSGGGPFFGEGWPLYWELTLYDLGFNKTPEAESRRALLAHAPLRADHLLAQVPHGPVVAAGRDRFPRRPRRPRARQRHRRSAPLVRSGRRLRPALSGRVPARRTAAARAAQGARRHASS